LRRPSLRSQLNQIRLWVRQGRTDAWIAHKLDISVEQLEQFKRDHRLDSEPEPAEAAPVDATEDYADHFVDLEELESQTTPDYDEDEEDQDERGAAVLGRDEGRAGEDEPPRRRRRGRRGGRRRGRRSVRPYEGTFDHGDEGYGLWLDPAVVDNPVYAEYWAGHRDVTVTVEPDAITIKRASEDEKDEE
jgi:hypothetical protein